MEELLIEKGAVQLRSISSSRSKEVSFGRLLRNRKVDEAGLVASFTKRTNEICKGKHVLSIQDTSELHYNRHGERIKDYSGLGDVGRCDLGYFMHPSLAVDAETGSILGLSDVYLWNRDRRRTTDASSRKQRPIEEKESYKWIASSERSQKTLAAASHLTIIQDRDGDMFEEFIKIPNATTDLLIRSRTDRKLKGAEESLYELVNQQACCISYELEITSDTKKRQRRKALMEIRHSKAKIQCPDSLKTKDYPEYVTITIVHAQESRETVPDGETGIDWKLLTTHEITDFMEAAEIVHWYSLRWLIEDFFRLLKKKGFHLESSELETGYGLRKLGLFTMQAAITVMQLRQARDQHVDTPMLTETVFDKQERACLEDLVPMLEGETDKLKNPYPAEQLIWATWIIARLGGWSGYESQRPPGLITLKNGLQKFNLIYFGWKIQNSIKDNPD